MFWPVMPAMIESVVGSDAGHWPGRFSMWLLIGAASSPPVRPGMIGCTEPPIASSDVTVAVCETVPSPQAEAYCTSSVITSAADCQADAQCHWPDWGECQAYLTQPFVNTQCECFAAAPQFVVG